MEANRWLSIIAVVCLFAVDHRLAPAQSFSSGSTGALGQTCVSPPSGLVGWWPGDGNFNDLINGDNGTPVGGVTFTPGMVGQAFSFASSAESVGKGLATRGRQPRHYSQVHSPFRSQLLLIQEPPWRGV